MLSYLRIRDLAIIDALEVELHPGLNVLTGETGAGKSILVDALGLVLGDKARNDLVRTGASQAEVEAVFDLGDPEAVRERLRAAGLDEPRQASSGPEAGELVVRRVVTAAGRSRAYVDGQLATVAQLATATAGLADISSQHEHHTLLDVASHLAYLDAFGDLLDQRAQARAAHASVIQARDALQEARARLTSRSERADFLAFQVSEIDAVAPRPGESAELARERERLRHAERILRAVTGAEEALYGRDGAVVEELGRIASGLREMAAFDPALEAAANAVEAAEAQLAEVARDLSRHARGVALDPERLSEIDDRLHAIGRLARKYAQGATEPEATILAHRARVADELEALERAEQDVAALESDFARAIERAAGIVKGLSAERRAAGALLGARIERELADLGMRGARVLVDVSPLEAGAHNEAPTVDGARLGPTGIDRVELLVATNAGEEPRPLRKIASGGELSRVLLAIKRVLAGKRRAEPGFGSRSLYVFDEVDTGVGGAVAEAIGRKLQEVARFDQVLCITHLAPIAIHADAHLLVRKTVSGGRTRSEIVVLGEDDRIAEVARMLGGSNITQKTRDLAAELVRSARAAVQGASR